MPVDSGRLLAVTIRKWDDEGVDGSEVEAVDGDYFHWIITIRGDGAYAGASFQLDVKFPEDFPSKGPEVKFVTDIFHPNVNPESKKLCLVILNNWNIASRVQDVVLKIMDILVNPESTAGGNDVAMDLYKTNPAEYDRRVQDCVRRATR